MATFIQPFVKGLHIAHFAVSRCDNEVLFCELGLPSKDVFGFRFAGIITAQKPRKVIKGAQMIAHGC